MKKGNNKQGNGQYFPEDQKTRLEEIRVFMEQELRQAALNLVQTLFEDEVEALCGRKFSRKAEEQFHRGGSENRAVIYVDGQRMNVTRPRIRAKGGEMPLESYRAMQNYDVLCDQVKKKLIRGISTRDYTEAISEIEGGLGLKHSSVSRAFIRASQKDLELINGRDLSVYKFVAIFLDGIEFAKVHLLVALGVTEVGKKMVLGVLEGNSENERVCIDLLDNLQNRGLSFEGRMLFVIDGAKAIHSALKRNGQIRL